jgi:hypothetical protein
MLRVAIGQSGLQASDGKFRGFKQMATLKHDFFIEDLGQPRGWFQAHRYRYSCLRCGWAFLIEGRRGAISALNELNGRLSEPERSRRVQTFVMGPCAPVPVGAAAPHKRPTNKVSLLMERSRGATRRRAGVAQIMVAK